MRCELCAKIQWQGLHGLAGVVDRLLASCSCLKFTKPNADKRIEGCGNTVRTVFATDVAIGHARPYLAGLSFLGHKGDGLIKAIAVVSDRRDDTLLADTAGAVERLTVSVPITLGPIGLGFEKGLGEGTFEPTSAIVVDGVATIEGGATHASDGRSVVETRLAIAARDGATAAIVDADAAGRHRTGLVSVRRSA